MGLPKRHFPPFETAVEGGEVEKTQEYIPGGQLPKGPGCKRCESKTCMRCIRGVKCMRTEEFGEWEVFELYEVCKVWEVYEVWEVSL